MPFNNYFFILLYCPRLKEEDDWESFFEVKKDIEKAIFDYNTNYPHSAIAYRTPCEFDEICKEGQIWQKFNKKTEKTLNQIYLT